MGRWRGLIVAMIINILVGGAAHSASNTNDPPNARRPNTDAELRYWLENMVVYHGFTTEEVRAATGLGEKEIQQAMEKYTISPQRRPARAADAPLLVLPYPGGRHPRIGFLDGAIEPQRETKVSIFTPWDRRSYVVVDVPEAIWSNLGLTYLAHTHIPTIWTERNITLEKLEWKRNPDGSLKMERRLPNGIVFGTHVTPAHQIVWMEMFLTNNSDRPVTDLRVQVCVMLKAAAGFNQQDETNTLLSGPYAAHRSTNGQRWIITRWSPCHRAWANPQVPCIHSDPRIPDCQPGQTQRIRGFLRFYEGDDIEGELKRLEARLEAAG